MSKLRVSNGTVYPIADYSVPNHFFILLNSDAEEVLEALTEENLSEIRFLTDGGALTGIYKNKLLCGYIDHGDTLEIRIDDADLCRYGLELDEDGRIVSVVAQRYAQNDAVIVDELPDGSLTDYLYVGGEYIYNPLPMPDQAQPTQMDRIEAQVLYTALMTDTLIEEV